jgi:acetyl-CoA synthetase
VATRLNDGEAKVLICADGYHRRGKEVRMKDVADQAVANVPSVSTVVVVERTGATTQWNPERDRAWARLLADADGRVETEPLDSEAPLMIIHTSGTTGRPKGTVHPHSGFPLKALQDLVYGMDGDEDDVLFWFSDFGWMMGPWVVFATLALGATMVLYDGSPETPGPDRLWTLIDRHQVSIFGLSPTLARSLIPSGGEVVAQHDLRSLRVVGSAGEVWDPQSWMWTFDHVCRGRIPLLNYCGGTEVSGGIVCGNVLTPLRPCSFAGPLPGMAADVVDQDGHSIRGRPGELVLRAPNPGMTRGFWRDRERYLDSYWSWLPGLWRHGDAALVDDRDGLWYVLGRSDDTMKIAGKRVGPGEVEAILMRHPDVEAAAAIGVPDPLKGEALACIVVRRRLEGSVDDAALAAELSDAVAKALGKATRPAQVRVVADLPRTRSGKIVRRAMRSVLAGREPGDLSAVENPEALAALAPFAPSAPADSER